MTDETPKTPEEAIEFLEKNSDLIRAMWHGSKRQSMLAQRALFGPPYGWTPEEADMAGFPEEASS